MLRSVLRSVKLLAVLLALILDCAIRSPRAGVEAAVSVDLVGEADRPEAGEVLTLSALWNLNDFRFSDDPQHGDNRIAGTPPNVVRVGARYSRPELLGAKAVYVAPQIDWVPRGAFADQANSARAPGYALVGVEAGFEPRPGVLVYLDARNLTDKAYVSDISTAIAATPASAIYYPGERRSVFAGLRLSF